MTQQGFGIGDFVASFKGDVPGHKFHGNQYSDGSRSDNGDYIDHPKASNDGNTYYRGGYGRQSNYATTDPQIANTYARRAVTESGLHPDEVKGTVENVLYNPKKEANFSGMRSSVTPDEFLGSLKQVTGDKTWGYDEAGQLARSMGYKRGDEYIQTWRYLEHKPIVDKLSAAGFDGVRFNDHALGSDHEAVMTIGEKPKSIGNVRIE